MTGKGQFECREQGDFLITECGESAANATNYDEILLAAKAAGDLLLGFDQP